jgi:hypothetical protein
VPSSPTLPIHPKRPRRGEHGPVGAARARAPRPPATPALPAARRSRRRVDPRQPARGAPSIEKVDAFTAPGHRQIMRRIAPHDLPDPAHTDAGFYWFPAMRLRSHHTVMAEREGDT